MEPNNYLGFLEEEESSSSVDRLLAACMSLLSVAWVKTGAIVEGAEDDEGTDGKEEAGWYMSPHGASDSWAL